MTNETTNETTNKTTNKTTKDIIFLVLDFGLTILFHIVIWLTTLLTFTYGVNYDKDNISSGQNYTYSMAQSTIKRKLNHIDTPEEIPEVSYNTYYLLTWHSTTGTFVAEGSLNYYLDNIWTFDNFPEDTLFISTYDNDILTLQQFEETYTTRDILLNRSSDLTMIVPYIATFVSGVQENYNILISLNTFLYNPSYRFLNVYNNVGTYTINTYWSIQNSDNTLDNEYIIQWGQPMLLLQNDIFTHRMGETLVLQAFIQPISIKYDNENAISLAYQEGYENGLKHANGFWYIVEKASSTLNNFFTIEIIPGLTLATIIGIFIGLPLFIFFLKLISAK